MNSREILDFIASNWQGQYIPSDISYATVPDADLPLMLNDKIMEWSQGAMSGPDILVLTQCCQSKDLVVELGTGLGGTTKILAHVAKAVITVDIFEKFDLIVDDLQRQNYRAWRERFPLTYADYKANVSAYYPNISSACALTYEYANYAEMKDCQADVLFIDADHSYVGVKKDFTAWFPKVKDNGIILFHDTFMQPGVAQFLSELPSNYGGYQLVRLFPDVNMTGKEAEPTYGSLTGFQKVKE